MRLGQISFLSFLSQILASVIGFVATVAITQVFGAEAFGTYALIVAVVIWMKILATMGVQSAVTKRVSEGTETAEYIVAGLLLQGTVLAILSSILLLARGFVGAYVGAMGVDATYWIIGLSWAGATLAFVRGALQGQHRVHFSTALKPLDRTVRSVIQIAAVLASFGLAGILLGYGVGALVAAAFGVVFVDMGVARPERRHFVDLIDFAKFSWLTQLSSRSFNSMDTIVLGAFVGSGLIGIYEASWNLASMLAVFGTAVAQTMFPEMSEVAAGGDREAVTTLLEQSLTYAGLFLIPGLVGAAIVGDLVLQVYRPEFAQGHHILVLLVAARLVYVYVKQVLTALNGLDRPDLAFRINATFVVANVAGNVVLVLRNVVKDPPGPPVFLGAGLAFVGAIVYLLALVALSTRFRTTVLENVPVQR